jgi:hypothetical protein
MCLGGGGDGGASDIQERNEQLERERQERIRSGADIITQQFSRFDDRFFGDFKNKFLNFFEPQLDKQSNAARGKGIAALTDRGILESTEGIRALTDIQDVDALERTNLTNRSLDEVNKLRSGVEREKTNLFALNETAADPARIAPLAQGGAASFAAPNAFNPLEDVFGSVLNSVAAFQAARNNAIAPVAQRSFAPSGVASSGGSGRVVGG